MSRIVFPTKGTGESPDVVFDFTSWLAAGETLLTAVCTATVYSGTDASPSSLISGSASISGAKVTQLITGGVEGVVYDLLCTVTTSLGQTLQLAGFIAAVPALV